MSSVKVSVRVRPFNGREQKHNAKCIIEMQDKTTRITCPDTGKHNTFTFDFSHWSHVKDDNFANQEKVYNDIGKEMLEHSFEGYNVCIFAYGQTGAGKSYSMMGTPEPNEQGLIPRACEELFTRINYNKDPNVTFSVEVSYMEIYNEKVRDLLNPRSTGNLKVREHPLLGPYVEDLSKILVSSFQDISDLMDEGNKSRTVAATNMNETSSRSHAVFSLIFTQKMTLPEAGVSTEKVSKISLVDLAGSERADSTGATGARLKEGANINKSLTTLGKVISALAEVSDPSKKKKKGENFIPYRDSVLTWLLKESIGGNSKTAMVAALSPADINYDETLSTLRYADRAKQIVCQAVVNEDPNAKLIRELKDELTRLRSLISESGLKIDLDRTPSSLGRSVEEDDTSSTEKLKEQYATSSKLMAELSETYEDKVKKSHEIQASRAQALHEMGIALKTDGEAAGLFSPKKSPHLVNLNEDPLMSELLVYYLPPGLTRLGRPDAGRHQDIPLSGEGVLAEHCVFDNDGQHVTVTPVADAPLFVNGELVLEPTSLDTGCRLILGENYVFRFVDPEQARRKRESVLVGSPSSSLMPSQPLDWAAAQRERLEKTTANQLVLEKERQAEVFSRMEALEAQIAKEKEAAERLLLEQRQKYEEQLHMLQSQEALSTPLAPTRYSKRTQRILRLVLYRWRKYRFVSIKTELLAVAPLLKEANAISAELNKGVMFQFVLISQTPYSQRSAEEEARPLTHVAVQVFKQANPALSTVWPVSKLKERIFDMREMYHAAAQGRPTTLASDPFMDRTPWFKFVGRALLSLSSLLYCLSVEIPVLLLNEGGQTIGRARISVQLDGDREALFFSEPEDHSLESETDTHPSPSTPTQSLTRPSGSSIDNNAKVLDFSEYGAYDYDTSVLSMGVSETSSVYSRQPSVLLEELDLSQNIATTAPLSRRVGSKLRFSITVHEVGGIPLQFSDVFCQLRFKDREGATFSTESLRNRGIPLSFHYTQSFSVEVTRNLLEYLAHDHVYLDLYGHTREHPLKDHSGEDALSFDTISNADLSMSKSMSVKAHMEALKLHSPRSEKKDSPLRLDVLAYTEISELGPLGEYEAVNVDHFDEMSVGMGVFLLQQGVQRRVAIAFFLEHGAVKLGNITELSLGMVRLTQEIKAHDGAKPALPLTLLHDRTLRSVGIDQLERYYVEAAWDSSRHDVLFLNRITPNTERVYATISVTVEVEKCVRPTVFHFHVCLKICSRDVKPTPSFHFSSLFGPKIEDANKSHAIFQLLLKPTKGEEADEEASKRYVRGEEYLSGWRPRGVSLIIEHHHDIDQLYNIIEFEKTKQHLAIHDQFGARGSPSKRSHEEEHALATRCLSLMRQPALALRLHAQRHEFGAGKKGSAVITLYNPLVVQPALGDPTPTKGYLNFLEAIDAGWKKYFVIVRRPYVLLYLHEKDPVVRGILHLDSAKVQFSPDRNEMVGMDNVFHLFTNNRSLALQAGKPKDVEMWLNVFDPLYAGAMLSQQGLKKR